MEKLILLPVVFWAAVIILCNVTALSFIASFAICFAVVFVVGMSVPEIISYRKCKRNKVRYVAFA